MGTSKKSYKINIKHPVYAVLLTDDSTGATYGDIKEFGEAQKVTVTPNTATGSLYGNGSKVDASAKMTSMTVEYETTKIPIETIAAIYNQDLTSGVMTTKSTNSNYIAFGYEVEQTTGDSEYVWLLKGRPQPLGEEVDQSTDNITYSTDKITIEFVARTYDDAFRKFADAANSDFTGASTWFDAVP